jgi:hypothetical protein
MTDDNELNRILDAMDAKHDEQVIDSIRDLEASLRDYRIAYPLADGGWDIVDTFRALDDSDANAYAETHYDGDEWYVLDANNRNINGGRDQE